MIRAIAPGVLSVLIAIPSIARPVGAQGKEDSALSTAAAFFAALHEARWADAASMVDSASAQATRDFRVGTLVVWAENRAEAAKVTRGGSGGMVAYGSDDATRPELIAHYGAMPVKGFGAARTLAQVAALAPREFLARAFALSDSMFTTEDAHKRSPLTRGILGDVIESDSIAHVLYRVTGPTVHSTDPLAADILRLRRRGHDWYVDLTIMEHDVLGGVIAAMLNDEDTR